MIEQDPDPVLHHTHHQLKALIEDFEVLSQRHCKCGREESPGELLYMAIESMAELLAQKIREREHHRLLEEARTSFLRRKYHHPQEMTP